MKKVRIGISGSETALYGVSMSGSVLMFMFDSVKAQNAIQLIGCAGLAAVIVRGQIKSRNAAESAVRLATELLLLRKLEQEGGSPNTETPGQIAPIIQLPAPRGTDSGRSEVS